MKRILSLSLVLALVLTVFAGCAAKPNKPALEGTPTEIIEKIYNVQSVEFMAQTISPDDPDLGGMWNWTYFTGLESGDGIAAAAASEPMMGSIAFSLVTVRVEDAANAKTVAQQMKDNIDTRKWICVEAGDLQVAGYGDVVMLIMVDEMFAEEGLTSQMFVDAFATVCGAELDFVI